MPNAREQYQLAFNYNDAGELDKAETCLRDLLLRYPEHPDVLHLLGIVLKNLDKVEEAEQMFRSAVEIYPDNARYHYHYGLALVKSGRPDKAAEAFHNAVAIDPELRNARYNLAKAHRDSGDLQAAIRIYQGLLIDQPGHVEALYNLANLFCDLERYDEAEELYQSALSQDSRHTNSRTNLAFVQEKLGRRSEAIENLRAVLEIEPHNPDALKSFRRLVGQNVPGWHFSMLNDKERNDAYDRAITDAANTASHVLEIGTGSGLLAMMAARAGARKVTTCEMVTPLAQTASRIIRKNGYGDRIQVINKKSTQLQLGTDITEPADVLIAEVFDVGLLGEHFLSALQHAKRNLLLENATIIPAAAKVYGVLIECPELRSINPIKEIAGFDLSDFDVFRPSGYMQIKIDDVNHRAISNRIEICHLDFQNEIFLPSKHTLSIKVAESGACHAIVFWFDLYLDQQTILSTRSDRKNNHWKQALQFFSTDYRLESGQRIKLNVHRNQTGLSFSIE